MIQNSNSEETPLSYVFFKQVDESTQLGKLINLTFGKLMIVRNMHAPTSYNRKKECDKVSPNENADVFYNLCLGELYLHSIVKNLNRWQSILSEYNQEFQGSWKYYAASKRLDYIKEFGGDEDDFNEDGTIKTAVSEEKLVEYSVVNDLLPENWNDIFQSTQLEDMIEFLRYIFVESEFSIIDVFRKMTGATLKTYRIEAEGPVENTFADELLYKMDKKDSASSLVNTLFSVMVLITGLIKKIRKLDLKNDNRTFFLKLSALIQRIFDLKIEPIQV